MHPRNRRRRSQTMTCITFRKRKKHIRYSMQGPKLGLLRVKNLPLIKFRNFELFLKRSNMIEM